MKKMNNYNFTMNWYGGLTEEMFLKAMCTNNASDIFKYDNKYDISFCLIEENKDATEYCGMAILVNGYVDIEMNFFMNEKNEPVLDFFCCAKYGDTECDWYADDWYIDIANDDSIKTDFNKDDWKEQLEKEMFEKLSKYCEVQGYDYTKPIKF